MGVIVEVEREEAVFVDNEAFDDRSGFPAREKADSYVFFLTDG